MNDLDDGYDALYVDVAHVYRDHDPNFDRPYPVDAAIATDPGVRIHGDLS